MAAGLSLSPHKADGGEPAAEHGTSEEATSGKDAYVHACIFIWFKDLLYSFE